MSNPILFFDGVCGLCNRSVDLFLKIDTEKRLRFAPLQGETAQEKIPELSKDLDTFVLVEGGKVFVRSEAVLRSFVLLGHRWPVVLLWIPKFVRDFVYRVVARVRYFVFGKRDVCRIPSADEVAQFLP